MNVRVDLFDKTKHSGLVGTAFRIESLQKAKRACSPCSLGKQTDGGEDCY